jgi:broad specificity phosphatase PhoE
MRHPHIDLATQRCIGQTDVDLSFEGRSSLKSLAREACRLSPDRVVSSDLKRCRLLAEEIAGQLRIRPVFDPLWREIDFGFWENRTWEAIRREETEAFAKWVADFVTTAPPGGESFLQLQKRILSAIDAILPDRTGETAQTSSGASNGLYSHTAFSISVTGAPKRVPAVLVVTHAGVMRAAYAAFANLPLSRAFDHKIPYGGMFHVRRCGNVSAIESTYPFLTGSAA